MTTNEEEERRERSYDERCERASRRVELEPLFLHAGTLKYQAPEQLRARELLSRCGPNSSIDMAHLSSLNKHPLAADVYAFGCLLHELAHVGTTPRSSPGAKKDGGWLITRKTVEARERAIPLSSAFALVRRRRAACAARDMHSVNTGALLSHP